MPLAQREVKTGIHSRPAKNVVQQIKAYSSFVMNVISTVPYHDMSLMCAVIFLDEIGDIRR